MSDVSGPSLAARAGAFATAGAIVRQFHPNEIGGVLVGRRTPDGILVEDFLHLPGEAVPTRFERRHAPAQRSLDSYLEIMGSPDGLGYVGEWHSHPSCHSASTQDLTEIADLAVASQALLGLIVVGADLNRVVPYPYLCDGIGLPWPTVLRLRQDAQPAAPAPTPDGQPT